jgi:hypothetical protein
MPSSRDVAPARPGSPIADFSIVKTETIRSSETSVHTGSIRRHFQEDDILQRRIIGKLNFYKNNKTSFFKHNHSYDRSNYILKSGVGIFQKFWRHMFILLWSIGGEKLGSLYMGGYSCYEQCHLAELASPLAVNFGGDGNGPHYLHAKLN